MGLLDDAKGLLGKAEELAKQHPDQIKEGLAKVEGLVDQQTGGKFTDQIHKGGDALSNALGTDAQPDAQAPAQPPAQQ